MGTKSHTIAETDNVRLVQKIRTGQRPRYFYVVELKKKDETSDFLVMNFGELFNLTEMLDDLCDAIEDVGEDGLAAQKASQKHSTGS